MLKKGFEEARQHKVQKDTFTRHEKKKKPLIHTEVWQYI